jgi:hypothetical protein
MRTSKPITVTLGPMQASLEKRLQSGGYDNASEILRSALRAPGLPSRSPIPVRAFRHRMYSNAYEPSMQRQ